jgi:DNA-binding MarR family transcriptional regulator
MGTDLFERLPLGRSLSLLAKTYFGALTKRLEHLEIERHYSILIFIEESEKGCSQQHICDNLKIDKVSMVRMLDYLIKKKFIRKVQNPKDRREYFVELTQKAQNVMPEIHAEIKNLNDLAFKGMSKEKQKEFYRNICLIYTNVESLPAHKFFVNYKKANREKK